MKLVTLLVELATLLVKLVTLLEKLFALFVKLWTLFDCRICKVGWVGGWDYFFIACVVIKIFLGFYLTLK